MNPGTGNLPLVSPAGDMPAAGQLAKAGVYGDLEVLPLDDLHVDHAYQRDISTTHVQKIAEGWDIAVAGAIVVSRRPNGDLYIVDGFHRAAAARLAGETEILAQVIEGLERETEAAMRVKGNVRRGDKSLERFKALLAAGDPDSIAITEVCSRFDTRINAWPSQDTGINAVAAVEAIYRIDKGITLVRVFEFIRAAYGTVEGRPAGVAMLKGVTFLLQRHGEDMDRGRMVERLGVEGVAGLDRKARSHKAAMGGALWTNYYRAMIEVYNERLPEGSRLQWRTGGWTHLEKPEGTPDPTGLGGNTRD